tara:strand:- start:193 stop:1281 length:1089 start_codon:yes stop_codon:yes gene_type:complete
LIDFKNSLKSNNDITIIIITYNRYSFLLRLLNFYDSYEHNFNFLILDSSNDAFEEKINKFINRKNFIYKKFSSKIFFAKKISEGCKFITTQFSVLCADDDFLIPKGIIESKNFLIKNKDYSSAHGLYFNHTGYENSIKKGFSIGKINNIVDKNSSAEESLPEERLRAYFSNELPLYPLYALHRSKLFKLIWEETGKNITDWGLSELCPSALSITYGKMKILNVFYSSREPNQFIWYNNNQRLKMFSNEKVKRAIKIINNHLCQVNNNKENLILLNQLFNKYTNDLKQKLGSGEKIKPSILSKIRNKIGLRTTIRKYLYNGSHPSIHPKFKGDYLKLKKAVLSSSLTSEELNNSRSSYRLEKD